jgi:hypothetical protein
MDTMLITEISSYNYSVYATLMHYSSQRALLGKVYNNTHSSMSTDCHHRGVLHGIDTDAKYERNHIKSQHCLNLLNCDIQTAKKWIKVCFGSKNGFSECFISLLAMTLNVDACDGNLIETLHICHHLVLALIANVHENYCE